MTMWSLTDGCISTDDAGGVLPTTSRVRAIESSSVHALASASDPAGAQGLLAVLDLRGPRAGVLPRHQDQQRRGDRRDGPRPAEAGAAGGGELPPADPAARAVPREWMGCWVVPSVGRLVVELWCRQPLPLLGTHSQTPSHATAPCPTAVFDRRFRPTPTPATSPSTPPTAGASSTTISE